MPEWLVTLVAAITVSITLDKIVHDRAPTLQDAAITVGALWFAIDPPTRKESTST